MKKTQPLLPPHSAIQTLADAVEKSGVTKHTLAAKAPGMSGLYLWLNNRSDPGVRRLDEALGRFGLALAVVPASRLQAISPSKG